MSNYDSNTRNPAPTLETVPERLEIEEHDYFTYYVGERVDLVAAGVLPEDAFPILPKRVRRHLGPHIPTDEKYSVTRIKGGRFRVMRDHEKRKPARKAWDPIKFKNDVLLHVNAYFHVLKMEARGQIEADAHQAATHRLSEKDVAKIAALGEQAARVILEAKVERARQETGPRLAVVK